MIKKVLLIWPYTEQRLILDKVLLYKPATVRFPLGIGYLAAYLEPEYEVEILDITAERPTAKVMGDKVRWGLSDDEIKQRIEASGADVIGISQMFSYMDTIVRKLFRMIREIDPQIVTIWGGTHPTVMPRECVACEDVDYIILGEGERPLKELLRRLNSNEGLQNMKSIAYRDKYGKAIVNNERLWIDNLDSHVRPARHKVDMDVYLGAEKVANMVTSRGCSFDCTFCTAPTFYQKTYRTISPEMVVDEMEDLIEQYGARTILIQDENLTLDMKRVEQIMDMMIERKIKIPWYANVGVTVAKLNEVLIRKMKETGCTQLRLAIESGNEETLKQMRKPMRLRHPVQVMKWARECEMKIMSFLLLGMPGESLERMQQTIDFALELGCDWNSISMVLPLPGTKIYDDLVAKGFSVELEEMEWYTWPVRGVSDIQPEDLIAFRERANNLLNFEQNYNLTRGNVAVAIRSFSDLTLRYPELEKMWFYLGIAQYKSGRCDEALESFRRAYKLNPTYRNVSDWVEALDTFLTGEPPRPHLPDFQEQELNYTYGHDVGDEVEEESLFGERLSPV